MGLTPQCERVEQVDQVGDSRHDADLTDVSQGAGGLCGQTDDVVLTNGHNLDGKCVLIVVGIVVGVVRYQLLGCLVTTGNHSLEEVNQFLGVVPLVEEEINAFVNGFYVNTLVVRLMFDQQLFQIEESLSMGRLLSHLNHSPPEVFGLSSVTVVTHVAIDHIFDDKHLLKNSPAHHFFLDSELHFNPSRVRLCPDERRVDQTDLKYVVS